MLELVIIYVDLWSSQHLLSQKIIIIIILFRKIRLPKQLVILDRSIYLVIMMKDLLTNYLWIRKTFV